MTYPLRARVLALVLSLSFALSLLPGAEPPRGFAQVTGVLDPALARMAAERPSSLIRVLIHATRESAAQTAAIAGAGVVKRRLPTVGVLSVEMRADRLTAVAASPGVRKVLLDPLMRPAFDDRAAAGDDTGLPPAVFAQTSGAEDLWARGLTGSGITIAVLDSGLQLHDDLRARVKASQRFNDRASSVADQYGHGTWVAGIAAGDGSDSNGRYRGIAPGASLLNLKVSDDEGRAYLSDVVDALNWVRQNRAAHNVRVVNLSLVSSAPESYATSILDAAVEMVWHAGIVVVASAGNQGAGTVRYAPANDPYVITVGASDDLATRSPLDDTLAWFSSYGPTPDGLAKPDLVAPGRRIVGALASRGSTLAREYPSKVVKGDYIQLSGTSASAPVVAGATALLLQARPDLRPDQVKWLLTHTARSIPGSRAAVGAGQLDVLAASLYSGSVEWANRGVVPNVLVGTVYLSSTGSGAVSWDSVSWDSVSWDSVSWDSVSWDSVSWDSVSWDSVSWDSVSWDSVSWDSVARDTARGN